MSSMIRNKRRKNSWRWQGTILGKKREVSFSCNSDVAKTIQSNLDALVMAANYNEEIPTKVRNWTKKQEDKVQQKFARLGVWTITSSNNAPRRLNDFIEWHLNDALKKVEESSSKKMINAQRHIAAYYADNPFISDLTKNDCERFQTYLLSDAFNVRTGALGMSVNHTRRTLGYLKDYLTAAVDAELINRNPAKKLKVSVGTNEDKWIYINDAVFLKLMSVADEDMQLRLVLLRYLGLRCVSEFHTLKWKHVDWGDQTITIIDSKNKRHEKRKYRTVPIFSEVKKPLERAARNGSRPEDTVILYESDTEWRRKMLELIEAAGERAWPDLFKNFRRSAITDAANDFPNHVLDKWFGNTEGIRMIHYLQVTKDHYKKAIERVSSIPDVVPTIVPTTTENQERPKGTRRNRYIYRGGTERTEKEKRSDEKPHRTPEWAVLALNKTLKPNVF